MKDLIEHLEEHLGQIDGGWKDSDGEAWPYHVLRFVGRPTSNLVTYTTLGLGDTSLRSRVSSKWIRHELLFMARPSFCDRNIPALLHQVGMEAINNGFAYLRGDVIGPRGIVIPGTDKEALYITLPIYLPDSFATYTLPEGISTIFAWVVPISRSEASFIKAHGWNEFEERLAAVDPDLTDLARPSVV